MPVLWTCCQLSGDDHGKRHDGSLSHMRIEKPFSNQKTLIGLAVTEHAVVCSKLHARRFACM